MIKSRMRQPPSAGGNLTKHNTARLRAPKKTTTATTKKSARTNLKNRPGDKSNLEWDSGKLRLEMLSPQIVREAAATADKTASQVTLPASKASGQKFDDLETNLEKIELAKKLNAEALDSGVSEDLKATIAALAAEGQKVADQLKTLQSGKADRVDSLERTISDLRYELDAAKSTSLLHPGIPPPVDIPQALLQADMAGSVIDRLRGDNVALRKSLDESNALIDKLKLALHGQESEIKHLTGSVSELSVKERKSKDCLAHEEELRSRLKKELLKKTMDLERYTARARHLESQVKSWKGGDELVHAQAALARASAENVAHEAEIVELRRDLRESNSRLDLMDGEKRGLQTELKSLNPRLKGFDEQDRIIRTLELRLGERDTIIDQLRARLESLDHGKLSKISDLEHQLATIEVELARRKRSSHDTELKLEKSQRDVKLLASTGQAQLTATKDELALLKEQHATISEKLDGMTTRYAELSAKYDSSCQELSCRNDDIRQLVSEKAHNEGELENVQKLATRSSEQLLKIQQQCNDAIGMKAAAERQLEMACAEIRKAEEKHSRIREDHQNDLARSSASLQAQLSKLNAEIHSGKEEVREIERRSTRTVDDLERRLRQSEQMNQSLQEYVAYLKSMSDALTMKV